MIAWLSGKVVHMEAAELILNCNGVGYHVNMGPNAIVKLDKKSAENVEVYIYTSVKEDEIKLFGFRSLDERKIFSLLLSVNGIGPKAAMGIVDQVSGAEVISSIRNNDHTAFQKVSGIGKKTAMRVVLDLQGKVDNFEYLLSDHGNSNSSTTAETQSFDRTVFEDIKSALLNFGFNSKEADSVIKKYYRADEPFEVVIRKCLSELNKTK